jgi:hypothetical protein
MVDRSPWPATKLTEAWPTAALVTGGLLRRHGELEGSMPRLTGSKNGWWGGRIRPAMDMDVSEGYSSVGVVFQAGRRQSG